MISVSAFSHESYMNSYTENRIDIRNNLADPYQLSDERYKTQDLRDFLTFFRPVSFYSTLTSVSKQHILKQTCGLVKMPEPHAKTLLRS